MPHLTMSHGKKAQKLDTSVFTVHTHNFAVATDLSVTDVDVERAALV